MTDLIVRGGTVVATDGARRADVAIDSGRIVAIGPDLGSDAREVVDASGLLVLPGIVDVHTHTRVASDAEPDRFFQDSVAAAFGGTTTFLAFNNPGTGGSESAGRTLAAPDCGNGAPMTEGDSAVDYAVSLVLTPFQDDAVAEIPAAVAAGVPTFKAFMVYDFGLDDRRLLPRAWPWPGRRAACSRSTARTRSCSRS